MIPLADKIRPKDLAEFVGQAHLIGPGKPLRVAIEKQHHFSFILWGPPGSGKTTLARIYAKSLDAQLSELSAVSAGKADIRQIIEAEASQPKVLFLDEIHRFNKAQQDFLLPYVENGELILIGATTENPSFEVIAPLLSRLRVFVLEPLAEESIKEIIRRADPAITDEAAGWLAAFASGDARQALVVLATAQELYGEINLSTLREAAQSKHLRYDKQGEEHYNIISAYIKSLRAGQTDAAFYYLARMITAGEDPKFIARRLVIFASEDIGLAQPTALVVAESVFRAVEIIGLPEAGINLAHGTAYLAGAKKDRSAYDAYKLALTDVEKYGPLSVPLKIRNASTKLLQELKYGEGYEKYDPESYLPEELKDKKYLRE